MKSDTQNRRSSCRAALRIKKDIVCPYFMTDLQELFGVFRNAVNYQ